MRWRGGWLGGVWLVVGMVLAAGAPAAGAQEDAGQPFDPGDFRVGLEPVATGLDRPLYVTHAGDGSGRLFIVGKGGTIHVWRDGEVLATPFLDITDRVGGDGSEQGLFSVAFAPDYAESGLFYVDYTDLDGDTVVSRFTVTDDPNVADPASEEIVLTQDQPYANHNGGLILFGPDGYLYVGFGDGGSQGDPNENAESLQTWLGKILRIDVNPANAPTNRPYAIPEDNPFLDDEEALPEVWAYGVRNPWRFSFDRATGDFYLADVGGGLHEEVNVVPAAEAGGQNYGWDRFEGTACHEEPCADDGVTMPVTEYDTHEEGCSITGGYVYRGERFPALDGVYLFGDYCSGLLWGLGRDAAGEWVRSDPIETDTSLSSFGEDEAGEVYLTDLSEGIVYRIVTDNPAAE